MSGTGTHRFLFRISIGSPSAHSTYQLYAAICCEWTWASLQMTGKARWELHVDGIRKRGISSFLTRWELHVDGNRDEGAGYLKFPYPAQPLIGSRLEGWLQEFRAVSSLSSAGTSFPSMGSFSFCGLGLQDAHIVGTPLPILCIPAKLPARKLARTSASASIPLRTMHRVTSAAG